MDRIVREYVQRGHLSQKAQEKLPPQNQKLRVAAYCRVSTKSDEQLNSYEVQVNYYTKLIQDTPNWLLVDIYADEGKTGTRTKRRKNFMRMIDDAMSGKIDLIVVKSVARFARNTVDSLSTVRDLRDKNVKIFFEKENIDSLDPKCDMILSIYSSLAEEESRAISTNIRWSVQKRFEQGQVIMCFKNLYGYTVDENKQPVIVPSEAEVVKDIFFKFLSGFSFSAIISDLQRRGIASPKGKPQWSKSTLNSMLENEKYKGDAILQKTYKRDFLSPRRIKNTGQAPQKYVENNHPAIIDKEIWAAVQAELQRRNNLRSTMKTGKGRYSGKYAFSGKLVCCECGAGFRRHHYSNDKRSEPVWTCKRHIAGLQQCSQLPISERWLETVFVKTLNQFLQNKEEIFDQVETIVKETIVETAEETSNEFQTIDERILALQGQMLKLNKMRQRREIEPQTYNDQSQDIMLQLDNLFEERDQLTEQKSIGLLNKQHFDQIESFLRKEKSLDKFDKTIFIQLVEEVKIHSRQEIIFEFKNGMKIRADTDL